MKRRNTLAELTTYDHDLIHEMVQDWITPICRMDVPARGWN